MRKREREPEKERTQRTKRESEPEKERSKRRLVSEPNADPVSEPNADFVTNQTPIQTPISSRTKCRSKRRSSHDPNADPVSEPNADFVPLRSRQAHLTADPSW